MLVLFSMFERGWVLVPTGTECHIQGFVFKITGFEYKKITGANYFRIEVSHLFGQDSNSQATSLLSPTLKVYSDTQGSILCISYSQISIQSLKLVTLIQWGDWILICRSGEPLPPSLIMFTFVLLAHFTQPCSPVHPYDIRHETGKASNCTEFKPQLQRNVCSLNLAWLCIWLSYCVPLVVGSFPELLTGCIVGLQVERTWKSWEANVVVEMCHQNGKTTEREIAVLTRGTVPVLSIGCRRQFPLA